MREVELKFSAHGPLFAQSLDPGSLGVATVEELPRQDLRATYYDTPELRLARTGATLRFRKGEGPGPGGWDLKLPVDSTGLEVRDELHYAAPPGRVPEEILDLTTALALGSALNPVATLRTRRRRWVLRDDGASDLAILYDDEVSVLEGRRIVARFRELELEAREADRARLDEIGATLRAAGAMAAEPIPKVVRALGPRATGPPDVAEPPTVGIADPSGGVVVAALAAGVRRLLAHDPVARIGEDPEGVHQMRVAARRLRSDLKTFESLVEPEWAGELRSELKWIATALGDVRDGDVLSDRLRSTAPDLVARLGPLFERLDARREDARERLLEALRSKRYSLLLDSLVHAANEPRLTPQAEAPCEEVLVPLVRDHWKKLRRKARALSPSDPDEAFHQVRIRAKKARYAAEAAAPVLAPDAGKFARRVEKVQDVLGDMQDAVVAASVVTELAGELEPEGGELLLAAGRLVERQVQIAHSARALFKDVYKKLDRKKVTAWLE